MNNDSIQTCPAWLPDWRNPAEYAHLTVNTVCDYEAIEAKTTDRDADGMPFTRRNIKPGSLKAETTATSKAAFAWEFLRRNSEYQMDYKRLASMAEQHGVIDLYRNPHGLNANVCWPEAVTLEESDYVIDIELPVLPDLPPCLTFHAELYRTLTRWGLDNYLPDPCHDLHGMAELNVLFRAGCNVYPAVQVFIDNDEKIPYDGGVTPGDSQCWWMFDASLPLAPQIEAAKQFLEGVQRKHNNGKALSKSHTSPAEYIRYLRLLDAKAEGASDQDVMELLYSHIDADPRYHRGSQQFSKPRHDATTKNRRAAQELVNGGYRRIF